MKAVLTLSDVYRGQFRIISDDLNFRMLTETTTLLTEDGHIVNQDEAYEICQRISQLCDFSATDDAVQRMMEVRDERYPHTASWVDPFDGFQFKRYQRRCINVLRSERDCMLQLSPGMGKTYTSTFMALQRYDANECDKIVVWCPASLIYEWTRSLEASTNMRVGTPKRSWSASKRADWYMFDTSEIWVLNYERVRTSDYEWIEKALKPQRALFVFDEITKLSNRSSQLSKNMKKLCNHVKVRGRIALTATPVVKGPENFYNEFRIIDPSLFGTVKDFEAAYTYNYGEKDMWGNYIGYQNLPYMHVKAGAQVCSITKTRPEVAVEFPSKQELLFRYELSKEERSIYDEILDYGRTVPPDERFGSLFMFMLQRLCNLPEILLVPTRNPGGAYGEQLDGILHIIDSRRSQLRKVKGTKAQLFEEKASEILDVGEKLIVFASHTHNCLFPLAERMSKWNPLVYVGGMSPEEKDAVAQEFKTSADRNLLLMSDAGQVGLNFQECRYLMHYQTPVSHAMYEQRSDRISRVDSEWDSITVMRFVGEGTVEERVEDTMQGRRKLAQEMGMGGEYEELGSISEADANWFCGF